MNILISHRELGYFYGGAEHHIKEIIERLLIRGHNITILTEQGKNDTLKELRKYSNIKIVYIASLKISHSDNFKNISGGVSKKIKKFRRLTKYVRIFNNLGWLLKSMYWIFRNRKFFDITWSSKNIDTISMKILNRFVKIPYVVSLEGYDFIEAENTKKCPYVFTIAPFIRKTCKTKHNFNPHLITIGIDLEDFQVRKKEVKKIKEKYCKKNELLVLNVGRLVEAKDMETFIKSAHKVNKEFPNAIFIICGSGPEKENLKRLISKFMLDKKVFIVEGLSNKEIIDYYNASDIFVHVPKQGNHFGVVFLEAMAAGLPIVAANEDATPDTVGDAALLVPTRDELAMSNRIIKLLVDEKLRKQLSLNSIKRVKEEFNWDFIIPKIEELFIQASR